MEDQLIYEEDNEIFEVDYSPRPVADLDKLDNDLELIQQRKLDIALPIDDYDYNQHKWESAKGREVGLILAEID